MRYQRYSSLARKIARLNRKCKELVKAHNKSSKLLLHQEDHINQHASSKKDNNCINNADESGTDGDDDAVARLESTLAEMHGQSQETLVGCLMDNIDTLKKVLGGAQNPPNQEDDDDVLMNPSKKFGEDDTALVSAANPDTNTDTTPPPPHGAICATCGGRLLIDTTEATVVCDECGLTEGVLGVVREHASDARHAAGKSLENHCMMGQSSTYKRINHFNETLTQIQGQERTSIPQDLVDMLTAQFRKYRVTDMSTVTAQMVRAELKKMRLVKYYEHAHQIANIIAKRQNVVIPTEVHDKLKLMFLQIQGPFDSIRPEDRNNFLSYSYTIHKLLQLLGRHDLTVHFPLLKSRTKLFQQDTMWKEICTIMAWPFLPSI